MEYSDEQLMEKFKRLPEDIQQIIADQDTEEKIFDVGQNHQLHIDKIGELADETGLVLLGITSTRDFVRQLKERLQVDQFEAESIATEINSAIFLPIRESLKQLHDSSAAPAALPTRDQVLKEIENPSEPPSSVFEQKMSAPFSLPKNEEVPDNFTDSGYQNIDPYREPVK